MESNIFTEESEPIAEINIVPFVDIILVILIIFMITAPFVVKTGFSLALPSAGYAQKIQSSKTHITVLADGSIFFKGKKLTLSEIQNQLKGLDTKATQVVISADQNVLHGSVVAVINTVKGAGFQQVAISAQKKSK